MKITAIKQQVKNQERVSIFVDGKYSFSLSLDELLEQKIKNNEELDEATLNKLQKISTDGKLRMRALEWTLNRPRSIREFKDYTRRKKVDDEATAKLIEDFLAKGYLDEVKFTGWLVEVRVAGGKSNRAIAAELASKGIDRETTQEVLSTVEADESARIIMLINKKASQPRYKTDPQKLIAYLARQGFNYDLIKETLQNLSA